LTKLQPAIQELTFLAHSVDAVSKFDASHVIFNVTAARSPIFTM